MKKIIFLIFLFTKIITAQIGFLEYDHPVHKFFERMDALQIIDGYDPYELPITRSDAIKYFKQINERKDSINNVDKKILEDFLLEFEFDLSFTTNNSSKVFSNPISNLYSTREKFIYFLTDSSNFNMFVNFLGDVNYLYENNSEANKDKQTLLIQFGGIIRGSFLNNYGFMIKGTNGTFQGSKSLAQTYRNLRYNYKFNLDRIEDGGTDYYDETEGYIMADYDVFKIKLGRDRLLKGYGPIKTILSDNPPLIDYFDLRLKYGLFSFSYFHGKLLGDENLVIDPVQGILRTISEKYLAYHRFSFDFSRHLNFSIGEMVIYSRRSLDLSYFNPFNFYKSIEHSNQDRDNSVLFFDFRNNSINGITFYSTFMIDDIDFSKLGTDWFGNRFLFNAGALLYPLPNVIPLTLELQYLRIDPYFYSHRIDDNKFTHQGFMLGPNIQPNSETFYTEANITLHHRVNLKLFFRYTAHGENVNDSSGAVAINYGGNVLIGHQKGSAETAKFLGGIKETFTTVGFTATVEPINNYLLDFSINYSVNDRAYTGNEKLLFSSLNAKIKL